MNLLLMTMGSAGDVLPMLAIGRAMRARGHRVALLTNPWFQAATEREGIEFHPLGTVEHFEASMRNPDLWHPRRSFEVVAREGMLPALPIAFDLARRFDPADTLIAASSLMFGARVAQEALGHRLVSVHLQPVVIRSLHDTPLLPGMGLLRRLPRGAKHLFFAAADRWLVDPLLAPALNEFRAGLGLPPVAGIFGRWAHSPEAVLGLFPPWFAPPQPDWPPNTQLTGFLRLAPPPGTALAPVVEDFLSRDEPPIAFTAGSANLHAARFFAESIEAARRLGRRALLLTGHREQLPAALPDHALHVDWAPLSLLLPRAAALVSHGGIGTVAEALAAGIPQLIVPLAHDQPDNARRLERLGVARSIAPARYEAGAVAALLGQMLVSEPMASACVRVGRQVDFDGALAASCDVLEQAFARTDGLRPGRFRPTVPG